MLALPGWSAEKVGELFNMLDVGNEQDLSMDELELAGLKRRRTEVGSGPSVREQKVAREREAGKHMKADFHAYLHRNFGSVVRAWRVALDQDSDGRLRFHEFCQGCKKIGFRGRLKTLWQALDYKGTGFVCLGDLDPEAHQVLEDFRILLEENYRTLDDVFERVLDIDRSGRCTLEEFLGACRELGWSGNARKLFQFLDLNARGAVTVDELEFLGMRRRVLATVSAKQRILERQAKDRAEAGAVMGRFRAFLGQKCGNLVRAWRTELDPAGDGKLQFTEFCGRCRQIGFLGNLKALWLSLDVDDTGYVGLNDLDPEAIILFEDFKQLIRVFFADVDAAWCSILDPDGSGRSSCEEFIRACRMLGFRRDPKQLFRYLDVSAEGNLLLKDLQVLGLPRAKGKEALSVARDTGAQAKASFENYLQMRFPGSLANAWRLGVCASEESRHLEHRLSAEAFCDRCRELGWAGNCLALWTEYVGISSAGRARRSSSPCSTPGTASDARGSRRGSLCAEQRLDSIGSGAAEDSLLPARDSLIARKMSVSGSRRTSLGGFEAAPRRRSSAEIHASVKAQVEALGFVSLEKVAPHLYAELLAFRDLCAARFGSAEDTWRALLQECLKTSFSAKLRKVEFSQAARMVGFRGAPDVVFEACAQEQAFVSLEGLQFLRIRPPSPRSDMSDASQ